MNRMVVGGMVCFAAAALLGGGWTGMHALAVDMPESRAAAQTSTSFRDMEGHWALEQVKTAVTRGYVDGYEDGSFRPEGQVTRAEFIKMTASALKVTVPAAAKGEDWYLPFVNAAVHAGLHQWSDFTSGDWNTLMSRAEMARMAVRGSGQQNEDEKKWMYLATKLGLITGLDDTGTLGEDEPMTRAQAVTIIERILDVKAGKTLEADKHAVSRAEVLWHKTNIETMFDGIYIDVANTKPEKRLNFDNYYTEADNGNYKGWADNFIIIDLDDPNDPFRGMLPDDAYMVNPTNLDPMPLPTEAYAAIAVNHFEMVADSAKVELNRPAYLGVSSFFDPEGKYLDGSKLLSDVGLGFKMVNGWGISPVVEIRDKVEAGESFSTTFLTGKLFPKDTSTARVYMPNHGFLISFERLADFGQVPTSTQYQLAASLKK